MLTRYDYIVLVFFFAFIAAIGFVVKKLNKNTSDYFRGGGEIVWWLVGTAAFMVQFSAWTFTGAAGKAYSDGWIVAVVFVGNAVGYLVNYLWSAARFRQLRVVTSMEAVRDRYGKWNEQFFTWLQLPIGIIYASIWLNGLAASISPTFGLDFNMTIIITGLVVVIMSSTGGAWAIMASDFIMMLLLMAMSLLLFFLSLAHPAIGGVSGFIEKMPKNHTDWTITQSGGIIVLFVIAQVIGQIVKTNSLQESTRYLSAKDGSHARKAALLACILMLVGPIIWFVPPIAAAIIQPDIASVFPGVPKPTECSYIFMGMQTLPPGMMGLLLCGIFAATMDSMDSGLNKNAGIFVRNFYKPIVNPNASDKHLLIVGKTVSFCSGLLIIAAALGLAKLKGLSLYDAMIFFGGIVAVPIAIPLIWGMVFKTAPRWSAFATVIVGGLVCLIVGVDAEGVKREGWLKPEYLGFHDMNAAEAKSVSFAFISLGNIILCSLVYFATVAINKVLPEKQAPEVEAFFRRMNTPVDFEKEEGKPSDAAQNKMLAFMCYVYGAFIGLLALLFPNDMRGRLCFLFVGGFIAAVGGILHWNYYRTLRADSAREAVRLKEASDAG